MIDLRQLSFMDSSGPAAARLRGTTARRGRHGLTIVRGGAEVSRLVRLTRLDEKLPFADAIGRRSPSPLRAAPARPPRRAYRVAMDATPPRAGPRSPTLAWRLPPQLLFVVGALTQYVGAGLAVLLFARVPVIGVAWLRVLAAAVVMTPWARPWRLRDARGWTRERLLLVGGFGLALAGMNGAFYLAIDRLPLGTAVALSSSA